MQKNCASCRRFREACDAAGIGYGQGRLVLMIWEAGLFHRQSLVDLRGFARAVYISPRRLGRFLQLLCTGVWPDWLLEWSKPIEEAWRLNEQGWRPTYA